MGLKATQLVYGVELQPCCPKSPKHTVTGLKPPVLLRAAAWWFHGPGQCAKQALGPKKAQSQYLFLALLSCCTWPPCFS